jgi:N utilization substance protein A
MEEDDDDVNLDEFADEIEDWVIDALKGIGCDTAKNVLNIPRNELIKRTDLEEETIDNVLKVLKTEFE